MVAFCQEINHKSFLMKAPWSVVLNWKEVGQGSQGLLEVTESRKVVQDVFRNIIEDVGHAWHT